ncbi:CrcB family protein [Kocuria sp. JC486]|uniref:CrcB family protein n=1 Tax=Kocuria sp. JC486 TaxID=1970736 RepID=UPI0032AE962B
MKPPHRQVGLILVVVLGGFLGAACRGLVSTGLQGEVGGWPLATLLVNLAGAFGLGVLLEALAAAGPEGPRRRLLRLGLGTGFFGGFTTYSGFALDLVQLAASGRVPVLVGYVLVTLGLGLLSAHLGAVTGARWGRRRHPGDLLRGER